jgi:hypothetical protein
MAQECIIGEFGDYFREVWVLQLEVSAPDEWFDLGGNVGVCELGRKVEWSVLFDDLESASDTRCELGVDAIRKCKALKCITSHSMSRSKNYDHTDGYPYLEDEVNEIVLGHSHGQVPGFSAVNDLPPPGLDALTGPGTERNESGPAWFPLQVKEVASKSPFPIADIMGRCTLLLKDYGVLFQLSVLLLQQYAPPCL